MKSKGHLVAYCHKSLSQPSLVNSGRLRKVVLVPVASFLLEVAALEVVRRFSKARCPVIWSGLQALQVVCYPPFKWIQRWNPCRALVKSMQMLSRPLLVLSLATAFSDHSGSKDAPTDDTQNFSGISTSNSFSETHSDLSSVQLMPNTSVEDDESSLSKSWLLQLYEELGSQGITIPERINEEELQRFYMAANGDFASFLSSVKKTIAWRETYRILPVGELEIWSNLVFWHGFDVKNRPCLVVRLGLACMNLASPEKPRFAQAVVSQVEHGILHLVDNENPQIMVLVDCQGLSPLRVPMQIMRSCSSLLQDHFPKRLGCVFVIRLPPVARVIAQTFIRFLKPGTRQKLKFEGKMYQKTLSECLEILPSYLGGSCTCLRCTNPNMRRGQQSGITQYDLSTSTSEMTCSEILPLLRPSYEADLVENGSPDQILRTAVVGILILWVFIAFMAGLFDPESRPVLLQPGTP
ncbi:hypothetical protein M9H77_15909 [Catharanthus roseus]|uniref:Uncharacterized protein n=1 Tax=Catharanthus roseus TaxID=4058 RepID=A0ACC0AZ71_CATRO|nr:hypothetical protein M9H77_15909 [Catharanthus roseus]